MPDLAKRTSTRRKKLNKIWASKEWKEKSKAFIGNRGCAWCGSKEKLTVHHPLRSSYGAELYLDFYLSGCIVLCNRCHAALHHGRDLCACKEHYKSFEAAECFYCYSKKYPEVLEKVKIAKERQKKSQKEYRAKKYQESKKSREKYLKEKNKGNV